MATAEKQDGAAPLMMDDIVQPNGNATGQVPTEEANDDSLCVICIDTAKTHVLVPCGHACVCAACSEMLGDPGLCPVCRSDVAMAMRVFW